MKEILLSTTEFNLKDKFLKKFNNNMIKVAVGSTNPVKVKAVENVFKKFLRMLKFKA